MTKHHNIPVVKDGIKFASKIEAARWEQNKLRVAAKEICQLAAHPTWPLEVNGMLIGHYTADSAYMLCGERLQYVVEDVKAVSRDKNGNLQQPTKTTAYRLRKKLMKAIHGIEITEWPPPPPRQKREKRPPAPDPAASTPKRGVPATGPGSQPRMSAREFAEKMRREGLG